MWSQIVGKVRLAQSPWVNHSWHVTLYVTARGLTTSPVPHGNSRTFEIDFDFVDHELRVQSSDGRTARIALKPQSVAAFYACLMEELRKLDLPVSIYRKPNEVPDPIRFDEDETHRAYDAEYANRFWRILVQADRVFKEFRARFIGKCSPIHFFWGAADLAVTRFSGRSAPEHPGGIPNLPDWVIREAYSQEVCSCGFWAGGGAIPLRRILLLCLSGADWVRRLPRCSRAQPSIAVIFGSSFFPTMLSASQTCPPEHCSSSYKPRMTLQPILPSGIAVHWKVVAPRRPQSNTVA
jgi:Family of unknown function (DUF5996)